MMILSSNKVQTKIKQIESLLKEHDPFCQMILVGSSKLRKKLDPLLIYDQNQQFLFGRELYFIEDIRVGENILAFNPSVFVIGQEIKEFGGKETVIRKEMDLNIDNGREVGVLCRLKDNS